MARVNWQRVRDTLISIVCIGILLWAGWAITGQFVHAIVLLLLAMAVAFLLSPLVNLLEGWKVPRSLATIIVYIIVMVALVGIGYALVFTLIKQVQAFSDTIVTYANALPDLSAKTQNFLVQQGIPQDTINKALGQIEGQATGFAQAMVSNVLTIILTLTDALLNILLITVMSFYLTLDGRHIRDSILSIAPKGSLPHLLMFEDALNRVVGNYIRGQLSLAVIIAVLAGAGCGLIPWLGLRDYALIIGVLAFLFETIPMVGPALASLPAILVSLLLPDPFPRTFYVMAYFIIIQQVESNILGPRIVGHAVGLHPVASILALIVGVQLFGPFGALLATPVVAALWVVIASLYRSVVKGETPDEMLAQRRRPWVFRRPRLFSGSIVEETKNAAPAGERKVAAAPFFKGIDMHEKMEQLDLLRPVPDTYEQQPQASLIDEEE